MADQPDPKLDTQPAEASQVAAPPENDTPAPVRNAQRRRLLLILGAVVVVLGVLWLLYHFLIGVRHVSTDNAYVGADTAQITPLVAGAIQDVRVSNTQFVQAGTILATIDSSDARIALARAAADLKQAESKYRQTGAAGGALAAQVAARNSDIARAQAEAIVAQAQLDKAAVDLKRREDLAKSGAVSGDELTSARTAFAAARGQLVVASAAIAQARANRNSAIEDVVANHELSGTSLRDNPDVAAARTRYDAAKLDLERTVIRAPFAGLVAQRNTQIGQRVASGTQIMTIVPLDRMYVDANFKESQLRKVRIGQKAELTSDLYGGSVTYHGTVTGLAGGTGSAFALIPAQNATGNWIKVVQRLPVRIQLDPKELRDHPLRVGLSMDASIDVAD